MRKHKQTRNNSSRKTKYNGSLEADKKEMELVEINNKSESDEEDLEMQDEEEKEEEVEQLTEREKSMISVYGTIEDNGNEIKVSNY